MLLSQIPHANNVAVKTQQQQLGQPRKQTYLSMKTHISNFFYKITHICLMVYDD